MTIAQMKNIEAALATAENAKYVIGRGYWTLVRDIYWTCLETIKRQDVKQIDMAETDSVLYDKFKRVKHEYSLLCHNGLDEIWPESKSA